MTPTPFDKDRRKFLVQMVLGGMAASLPLSLLESCKKDQLPLIEGSGMVPFKIWEELLIALESSPDFHPGRIRRLVKAKDPEALFNYVRDEIVLIPSSPDLRYEGKAMKHGIPGVMRTGKATLREKAELLTQLFQEIGMEAEVIIESCDLTEEQLIDCYLRDYETDFAPNISDAQFERWFDQLEVSDEKVDLHEEIDQEAAKLSKDILKNVAWEDQVEKQKIRWAESQVATVKFKQDGQEKYAHLLDPKVDFGQLRNPSAKTYSGGLTSISKDKIKLELIGRHSRDPREKISLLKGEWELLDLLGKQVNIAFLKDLTISEISTKSINQISFFTPSFSLQGVDAERSFLEENSFLGEPITIEGDQIAINPEKGPTLEEILKNAPSATVSDVASLECKAKAFSFPRVRLEVFAKDKTGKPVEGLQTTDFLVKEDGQTVQAILRNNQLKPKILILSDSSLSMPHTYRGTYMKAFNTRLEEGVRQKYPAAEVKFWSTTSALYSSLLKASQENVDLILYCTDGHNSDKLNEEDAVIYATGAPALILDVEENQSESFGHMARLTGGEVLPAKDQEAVLQRLIAYVEQMEIPPYILEFNSSSRSEHMAKVELQKSSLTAEAPYEFGAAHPAEGGLISLHLKVSMGYRYSWTKVLAGADEIQIEKLVYNKRGLKKSFREMRNEVRGFLLGGAQLYIESEGPTMATALTDVLKAQLSNRKWGEAFMSGQLKEAKEEFEKGSAKLSGSMLSLLTQPKDTNPSKGLTFVAGYRFALVKTLWPVEDQAGSNSYDYFLSSNYRTLGKDPKEEFKKTAAITAQLALREHILFKNSTYSSLEKSSLISNIGLNEIEDKEKAQSLQKRISTSGMRKRLFPNKQYTVFDQNLSSLAYWQINPKSGELYGMLFDGTGGGKNPIPMDPQFEEGMSIMMNIVGILERIVTIASAGRAAMFANPAAGVSLAIVAKYGVTLAKIYGIVTQTIVVMDTAGMDDRIKRELQILACEVYKEIVFAMFGNAGAVFAGLESLIGMMSNSKSPFSCG